jgi:Replication initiation factor
LTATVSGEAELRSRDGNGLPLPGDTGATSPAWAIDWLAVSLYGVEAERVASLVSEAFHFGRPVGLEGWQAMGGARFYGRRYEYLGATLLADPQAPGARDHVHVVLSGEGCAIGVDAVLQLLVRLRMWSMRCEVARLDLAVDGVPFTPVDAYLAVQRRQVVSWVKRGRDGLVHHTWRSCNGDGEGDTLYLGGRSSQRFMRIYDRRGPTRIELEMKRDYAQVIAWELVRRWGDDAALARFVVACMREFCDFGVPADEVHGARGLNLLPWWEAFVRSVDRLGKLIPDRRDNLSVDRTLRWLDRAVVPSLAMVVVCYGRVGKDLLDGWIESAIPHLGPRHWQAISEFRYAYGQGQYAGERGDAA